MKKTDLHRHILLMAGVIILNVVTQIVFIIGLLIMTEKFLNVQREIMQTNFVLVY
ncbi:MAG: hypothetical protein LBS50_06365 [Prevotellaceae bacterium]|nr:hypothetical protein [Prevotellaceae bacterium]